MSGKICSRKSMMLDTMRTVENSAMHASPDPAVVKVDNGFTSCNSRNQLAYATQDTRQLRFRDEFRLVIGYLL